MVPPQLSIHVNQLPVYLDLTSHQLAGLVVNQPPVSLDLASYQLAGGVPASVNLDLKSCQLCQVVETLSMNAFGFRDKTTSLNKLR
jgi:hypothetical protein